VRPAVFDPIPLTPFIDVFFDIVSNVETHTSCVQPTVEKGGFEITAIMLFRNFFASVRLRVTGGEILSITEGVLGFLRWRNSTRRNLCHKTLFSQNFFIGLF